MSAEYPSHLSFPFRIGRSGRTAVPSSLEEHVKEELIQLILTNPGERLFLPSFGGGVRRLVFEGAGDAVSAVTRATMTDALSRWMGKRVKVHELSVRTKNETIEVDLKYQIQGQEGVRSLRFERKTT